MYIFALLRIDEELKLDYSDVLFWPKRSILQSLNIALLIGIKKDDFDNLDKILKEYSFIKFICIDVANGYLEHFSKFLYFSD